MTFEEIKELMEVFDESNLSKLKIEDEDFKIELSKEVNFQNTISEQVNGDTSQLQTLNTSPIAIKEDNSKKGKEEQEIEFITSPMVGTFYRAPSPTSEPYVKVGDKIKTGDIVCIVEAMKIMNEIQTDFDCEIVEVLVEDGEAVEFDTPLFKVKRI